MPVYYTTSMFTASLKQGSKKEKSSIFHHWKPLSEISPSLVKAVIASEDFSFFIHNGFDTNNTNTTINKGARTLYLNNRTISQQTATSLFLFPINNYFYNLADNYFTILIEFVWGKQRIMEVYLNSIEMGNSLFGAEAIAQTYFNKTALDLNDSDAALLAACLINPKELNPANPTTYILRRQAKILGIMENVITIN